MGVVNEESHVWREWGYGISVACRRTYSDWGGELKLAVRERNGNVSRMVSVKSEGGGVRALWLGEWGK